MLSFEVFFRIFYIEFKIYLFTFFSQEQIMQHILVFKVRNTKRNLVYSFGREQTSYLSFRNFSDKRERQNNVNITIQFHFRRTSRIQRIQSFTKTLPHLVGNTSDAEPASSSCAPARCISYLSGFYKTKLILVHMYSHKSPR
jgi:hypothetical protein